MATTKPLTDKERRFVDEFMLSGVAMDAYVQAGYSPKSASSNAHRLKGKEGVIAEIERRQAENRNRHRKTADDVVEALSRIAFGGMSKFVRVSDTGHPYVTMETCTPADLDLLQEVTVESFMDGEGKDARQVKRVKLKIYSRLDALKALAQHFGLFNGKGKNYGNDRLANLMKEIMDRTSTLPVRPTGPLGAKPKNWTH